MIEDICFEVGSSFVPGNPWYLSIRLDGKKDKKSTLLSTQLRSHFSYYNLLRQKYLQITPVATNLRKMRLKEDYRYPSTEAKAKPLFSPFLELKLLPTF